MNERKPAFEQNLATRRSAKGDARMAIMRGMRQAKALGLDDVLTAKTVLLAMEAAELRVIRDGPDVEPFLIQRSVDAGDYMRSQRRGNRHDRAEGKP